MVTIDSHVHLMRYQPVEHTWVTDEMPGLKRDFLPAELESLMAAAGLDQCIVVQARQQFSENDWLLDLARSWPSIAAIVGWVDLVATDLGDQLDVLSEQPLVQGFRHVVIDEPDDYLDRPLVRAGIRELGRRDYLYELLVLPHQLGQATDIARVQSNQRFVLDHVGLPDIRGDGGSSGDGYATWSAGLAGLAQCPNVSVKLSALDFRARWHDWTDADLLPYLDTAFELFGADRLMIGSNWPVCTLSSSYESTVGAVTNYLASVSAAERSAVLGETARRWYRRS